MFDFETCCAPQQRAIFEHLSFQRCSKSNPLCFLHFDLEMCFVPQRRALFDLPFRALWLFLFSDLLFVPFSSLTLPTSAASSFHIVESLTSKLPPVNDDMNGWEWIQDWGIIPNIPKSDFALEETLHVSPLGMWSMMVRGIGTISLGLASFTPCFIHSWQGRAKEPVKSHHRHHILHLSSSSSPLSSSPPWKGLHFGYGWKVSNYF